MAKIVHQRSVILFMGLAAAMPMRVHSKHSNAAACQLHMHCKHAQCRQRRHRCEEPCKVASKVPASAFCELILARGVCPCSEGTSSLHMVLHVVLRRW